MDSIMCTIEESADDIDCPVLIVAALLVDNKPPLNLYTAHKSSSFHMAEPKDEQGFEFC